MASGDMGEVIRLLESIQRAIADLKKNMDAIDVKVSKLAERSG